MCTAMSTGNKVKISHRVQKEKEKFPFRRRVYVLHKKKRKKISFCDRAVPSVSTGAQIT